MQLHVEFVSPTEVLLIDTTYPEYRHRFANLAHTEKGIEADHSVEKSMVPNPNNTIAPEHEGEFLNRHAQEVMTEFTALARKVSEQQ